LDPYKILCVMDPYKILCVMDLAGGICSYTVYDVIWSIVLAVDKTNLPVLEDDGHTKEEGEDWLLHHATVLKRAAAFVESRRCGSPSMNQP
jgi:hypothetical protein